MSDRLPQLLADAKREGWSDYIRNTNDERAVLEGCRINEGLGDYVCQFFRQYLRHSKGEWAGQPFELSGMQRAQIIMPLFSWIRPGSGGGWQRRFNKADIWVAKKNFKSTLAAGLNLYGLVADGEKGAEVYCQAVDREQAGIVFGVCADMVNASSPLTSKLRITPHTKTISVKGDSSSWLRALSAEITKHEGLNAFFLGIDEIHAFDDRGRRLYEALMFSMAARKQPMRITTSTAGEDETGIGYEVYKYSKEVLTGEAKDTSAFVYIAESQPEDDPGDPATWRKANPMLGVTIQESEMAEAWNKAKQVPRLLASFRRYRLNQWIKTSTPWLPMDKWDACGGPIDEKSLLGMPCGGGLDLSLSRDMTSFCLCFPRDDDTFDFLWRLWLPDDKIIERERLDRAPYREWAAAGWLSLIPGSTIRNSFIEEEVVKLAQLYEIDIAYDPYRAKDLCERLENEHGLPMTPMRQGPPSFNDPAKQLEALVVSGRMRHGDNPIMRVQAQRVEVKMDANNNIMPVKGDGKTSNRIDGVVAGVMALSRASAIANIGDGPSITVL